jgi:23S rRNA (guanine745-N1)-methyltransferase
MRGVLICPVRGCGGPLVAGPREARCRQGHAFDRGRSGYLNLLQPQDRRARAPGDPKDAVLARRRLLERGLAAPLVDALAAEMEGLAVPRPARVLDVGSGDGFFLAAVCERFGLDGVGVDISAAACDLAARRYPSRLFVVANADRRLPFADGAFSLVLSITGRKQGVELRRVLAGDGALLVVVPAEDDLAELRQAILGRALERDRIARVEALLGDAFRLGGERTVRHRARLDAAAIADVLASTYRGARHRERARAAELRDLDVTLAWRLLLFRPATTNPRGR